MLKPLPLSIGLLAGANSHRYLQQPSPFRSSQAAQAMARSHCNRQIALAIMPMGNP
jgi:hypothetical protein